MCSLCETVQVDGSSDLKILFSAVDGVLHLKIVDYILVIMLQKNKINVRAVYSIVCYLAIYWYFDFAHKFSRYSSDC